RRRRDSRPTEVRFVVPARVTTLAVLRGPSQLRSVWSRSRPDRLAILPRPALTDADPVSRSSSPLRCRFHSVPVTPAGRLSVLRVCVLAADKKEHYGSPGAPSNPEVRLPSI